MRCSLPVGLLCLALVPMLVAPALAQAAPESYRGFDVDLLAKSFADLTTYRTQYGEQEGRVRFDRWLQGIGQSRSNFDAAYDLWWKRWKADPTGQLEARFHLLNGKYVQEMNFADVPRHDQEAREGVTLDRYARISVALSRPPQTDPAGIDRVLRANGFSGGQAQWQKVNDAWTKAMHDDTSLGLVQQYGALYQKYAGGSFEKEQQDMTARILAEHNRQPPPPPTEPSAPPGIDAALARLSAPTPTERWSAARQVLLQCSLWAGPGGRNAADPRAAACAPAALRTRVLPLVLDALDHHGDDTLNSATGMLDFLGEVGLKDPSVKTALERALARDRARLAELQAQFQPIQDKAVPERITLRSKLDGYQATVRDLEAALRAW